MDRISVCPSTPYLSILANILLLVSILRRHLSPRCSCIPTSPLTRVLSFSFATSSLFGFFLSELLERMLSLGHSFVAISSNFYLLASTTLSSPSPDQLLLQMHPNQARFRLVGAPTPLSRSK